MDEIFSIYSRSLRQVEEWAAERWPRGDGEPEGPWQRSIRAKALDLLRGLLPAATLSHVGIYASGQAYEQLIMRLMASPLPEAREYGGMILGELKQVMPSFVSRVERPDRGGEWISYLEQRRERTEQWVSRLGLDRRGAGDGRALGRAGPRRRQRRGPARLLPLRVGRDPGDRDPRPPRRARPRGARRAARRRWSASAANRRHRPGRGFEALRYRFEIVSDYGAFRDLQRHRMLTCQWQRLGPDLGAGVPDEIAKPALGDEFERALEISRDEYERLVAAGLHEQAPYALSLAYRIRYTLDLNAREAMHLIELRSGREGHPTYRAVAQAMHERIAAIHPAVAAAMSHVDTSQEPRLERIMSEIRTQRKRAQRVRRRRRGAPGSTRWAEARSASLATPDRAAGAREVVARKYGRSTGWMALGSSGSSCGAGRLASGEVRGGFLPGRRPGDGFACLPGRWSAARDPADQEEAEVDEPEQRELEEDEGDGAEGHPERAPEAGQQPGPHRVQAGVDDRDQRSRSGRRGRSRRRAVRSEASVIASLAISSARSLSSAHSPSLISRGTSVATKSEAASGWRCR